MTDSAPLRERKLKILSRLNRQFIKNRRVSQPDRLDFDSEEGISNTFKPPAEIRDEYVEKLKRRIKELEDSTASKRSVSSRLDQGRSSSASRFDSAESFDPLPPLPKSITSKKEVVVKKEETQSKTGNRNGSPPINAKGSYDIMAAKGAYPSDDEEPPQPKTLSKHKKLAPIDSSNIPEIDPTMKLKQCRTCKRSFRLERIDTHQETCERSAKKRPVFDEKRARMKGTEFESFAKKSVMEDDAPLKKGGSFHLKLTVAKKKPTSNKAGGNPKPTVKQSAFSHPSEDTLTTCQYCSRKFSEASIEKHSEICQRIAAKPKRDVFANKKTNYW